MLCIRRGEDTAAHCKARRRGEFRDKTQSGAECQRSFQNLAVGGSLAWLDKVRGALFEGAACASLLGTEEGSPQHKHALAVPGNNRALAYRMHVLQSQAETIFLPLPQKLAPTYRYNSMSLDVSSSIVFLMNKPQCSSRPEVWWPGWTQGP
jgi:hypothetical protein